MHISLFQSYAHDLIFRHQKGGPHTTENCIYSRRPYLVRLYEYLLSLQNLMKSKAPATFLRMLIYDLWVWTR